MKRSIQVKEKELIDKLNSRYHIGVDTAAGEDKSEVIRWDNNGPVQFEEVEKPLRDSRGRFAKKAPVEYEGDGTETIVVKEEKKRSDASDATFYWGDEKKKEYEAPKSCISNDDWKEDYFRNTNVNPASVSLDVRGDNGELIDIEHFEDPAEDHAEARKSLNPLSGLLPFGKKVELQYERLMRNPAFVIAMKQAIDKVSTSNKIEGTQLRTQDNTINVDLPFPGEVKTYEEVNHPQHYNNYDVEVIDMMEKVFGKEATATFCKLNAFKYRMRAGTKPNQSAEKDLNKEKWYLNKKNELES